MKLYSREKYLSKIRGFYHDTELIKVITGVRRCGKSSLMLTIAEELRASGIQDEQIVYIDLDKRGFKSIKTPEELDNLIDRLSVTEAVKYVFIDEIQNVNGFEEVLNAFRSEGDYSFFITGSNSYLLSGELVTKLTGRYLEFEMFTLSFEEYLEMKKFLGKPVGTTVEELDSYILDGGFPKALSYEGKEKENYIRGIISEIFEKDIRRRVKIGNREAFEKVQRYVINNFGVMVSLTNILNDLARDGLVVKRETLNRYINILCDAKILYPCHRFDLKSRASIGGEQKYYLSDLGFYFALNTDKRINYGPVLENITFLYAKSKDYDVSVGRIGDLECDFVLRRYPMEYSYVQVAMTILSSIKTENREYAPLEKIDDNYPKYVLTRDDPIQKRNGIIHANIGDFMRESKEF